MVLFVVFGAAAGVGMETFGVEQLVADGSFGCGIASGVIRRDEES